MLERYVHVDIASVLEIIACDRNIHDYKSMLLTT